MGNQITTTVESYLDGQPSREETAEQIMALLRGDISEESSSNKIWRGLTR